jgi:SsrA-binding protein
MHKSEISKWADRVARERLVLVPLSIYFIDGRVKVELAIARSRTKGDKRQAIAERDSRREMDRALGRRTKGAG